MTKENNQKDQLDKLMLVVFLVILFLCIGTYLFYGVVQGISSIQTLAKLFTVLEKTFEHTINVLFIIFAGLATAVFLHYIFFELSMSWFFKPATAQAIGDDLRKALAKQDGDALNAAKKKLEGDMTFFADSIRRLSIDHFSSLDTLNAFFRSIVEEEFIRIRRNMMLINLASTQGPALGFLGTAIGMVACFYQIAVKQFVTPGDLAQSIQFALITTVLGLIIKTFCSIFTAILSRLIVNREQFLLDKFDEIFIQR